MSQSPDKYEVLYDESQLDTIVKKVAFNINLTYPERRFEQPIFLGFLKGSFMFFSDLMKEIELDCEVDFVEAKSYQGTTKGSLVFTKQPSLDLTDRNVIVVEDIIDSGDTIKKLVHQLTNVFGAKQVVVVSLLARQKHLVDLPDSKYIIGEFILNDDFVLGYGLDEGGKLRNVKQIFRKNF